MAFTAHAHLYRCLTAALLLAAGAGDLRAERLVLQNGNQVVGQIETETSDRVTIRTGSGRVSFPRSAIASIHRQTESEQAVAVAIDLASRGELGKALSSFEQKDLVPAARLSLDAELVKQSDAILGSRTASRADASRFLRYVVGREAVAPAALQVLLARYLALAGDGATAVATLGAIPVDFYLANAPERAAAANILSARISDSLSADGDPQQGLTAMDLLARIAPERITGSTSVLLRVREAQRLSVEGQYAAALHELGRNVVPSAPVLAWDEATRNLSRAEQQTSSPLLASLYETMHGYFHPTGFSRELIPIYERHISVLIRSQKYDEARSVVARLSRVDADIGAPVEHRIEFSARQDELRLGDMVGSYRLGVWAREVGLLDEARRLMLTSLIHPGLQENARLQLQLLDSEVQRRLFENAAGLLEKKRYEEARRALDAFRSTYPDSPYGKKAGELAELSRYRLWSASQQRPAEAEILRQNAERLFLQARYDEAHTLLQQLEVDFGGTEAAAHGNKLRDQIQAKTGKAGPAVGTAQRPAASTVESRRMAEIRKMARDLAVQSRSESP